MLDIGLKYRKLFNNRLNGMAYCQVIFDLDGKPIDYVFLEANNAFEKMTRLKRKDVIGKKVTDIIPGYEKSKSNFINTYGSVALTGKEATFEQYQESVKKWYSFFVYSPKKGYFVSISSDITKRKEAEEELKRLNVELEKRVKDRTKKLTDSNNLLKLSDESSSKKEYLDAVVKYIKNLTGCSYLGIRVLRDDGYIPFESFSGYNNDFLRSENLISIHGASCVCIRTILNRSEIQDKKIMTKMGSFYLEDSFKFMAGLSKKKRERFRGGCINSGFSSFAAIPIKLKNKIIGTIHIADKKVGCVSLDKVESLELLTPLIGEAIEKFNAFEKVIKSEEKYRDLVENISDAIYQLDTKGNVVYASPIIKQITGYKPEETIGKNVMSFVHVDDVKEAETKFKEAIFGKAKSYETRIIKKDGSIAYVRSSGHPLIKNGKIEGIVSVLADITDRKKKEKSLLESYNYLGIVNRKISMLLDMKKISGNVKGKNKRVLLDFILKSAINVSGADAGLLYQSIKSGNFNLLHSVGTFGIHGEKIKNISSKSYEIFEKLQREKEIISGSSDKHNLKKLDFSGKIKSFLVLPIKFENNLGGFIFLGFFKERFIDNHEIDFLNLFSVHASFILSNSQFFR